MTEADYQRILEQGFRIIRPNPYRGCQIQIMCKPGKWSRLEKLDTLEQMYRRFEILLQD